MKRIFKRITIFPFAAALLALGGVSCNAFLEETNYSSVTAENYFTEDNAEDLVSAVYVGLKGVYQGYGSYFVGTDCFTTSGSIDNSENPANEYLNTLNGSNTPASGVWSSNYKVISRANTVINRFENQIKWSSKNLEKKANGIAQAKALRGYAYYWLAQSFGGVPLLLDEVKEIKYDYTRDTEENIMNQAIADLEAAIPDLADESEYYLTKRAAYHMLADVYLSRGYTSYGKSSDFTEAARLAELAIGDYDIRSQSFAQLFDYDNQVNDEILLAMHYGDDGLDYGGTDRNNNQYGYFTMFMHNYPGISRNNYYGYQSNTYVPTNYFYELYEDNDTRDGVTLHRVIYADIEADVNGHHIMPGDTVLYFPREKQTDAQLYDMMQRHYVYDEPRMYYNNNGVTEPDIPGTVFTYSSNAGQQVNFPIFKKFDDPIGAHTGDKGEGRRDLFAIRVAETHLIAAEAYMMAGDNAKALAHINRVHERATDGQVVAYYTGTLTIDNILDERAMELAGEEARWVVLKRTRTLERRIETYNPHVIDHGEFNADIHYLRPIAEKEIENSQYSIEQNPGY